MRSSRFRKSTWLTRDQKSYSDIKLKNLKVKLIWLNLDEINSKLG